MMFRKSVRSTFYRLPGAQGTLGLPLADQGEGTRDPMRAHEELHHDPQRRFERWRKRIVSLEPMFSLTQSIELSNYLLATLRGLVFGYIDAVFCK